MYDLRNTIRPFSIKRVAAAFVLYCLYTVFPFKVSGKEDVRDFAIKGHEILRIQPETQSNLRNPLTGWVLYAPGNAPSDYWQRYDNLMVGQTGKSVKIEAYANTLYMRLSWSVLNPRENVYAWQVDDGFKSMIANALRRGMRLAFRVVVDSRDRGQDASPSFVKEAGAKGFISGKGGVRWSPYPDDSIFQRKYETFVRAFAAEYNDPDRVDFVDGFGLGKWGEAHSMRYQNVSHRERVFQWVVDLYSTHFTKIPLAINYHRLVATEKDWDKPDAESERLLEYAFDKGYILRHDAFGMSNYYQEWERALAAKWNFKRPILMEGGWVTHQHTISLDSRGYQTVADVRQGEFDDSRQAKVNTMDFRYRETESWFENSFPLVERFIAEGGYRLYPDLVSLPQTLKRESKFQIVHRWNNLGWGYCPTNIPAWNQKYKVAFTLLNAEKEPVALWVDDQTDLSKWLKDAPTTYRLSSQMQVVPTGKYRWAIALVDRTKSNLPGIKIAAKGNFSSAGWLILNEVAVR